MRFTPTPIPQLLIVDMEPHHDERGFFARAWCEDELADQGLAGNCVQVNVAYNKHRATLRGMHFQLPPHTDDKLVRVVRGAIHDVVLDLREDSPAYGRWFSTVLDADQRRALFVPKGCAHGYLTLTDDSEMFYFVTSRYNRQAAGGVHWNSDVLDGAWPFPPLIISQQDAQWPAFALTPVVFAGQK